MRNDQIAKLLAIIAENLPVVVALFDVFFHDIESLGSLFVQLIYELCVTSLKPPDSNSHQQSRQACGSDLIPDFRGHRMFGLAVLARRISRSER